MSIEVGTTAGLSVDLAFRTYRCCVDGRRIRGAVESSAGAGYLDVAADAPGILPAVLGALNEIAASATLELAEEAGFGEGARLATSRRAMLAAIHIVSEALREELPARVKDLRDEGVTWREIGELLELTPEGAQRRFDPVAGEKAREASRRARERQREAESAGTGRARSRTRPRRSPRSESSG